MQDYWRELPFPSPGDLPDPGIKPACPAWQVDSLSLNNHRSPILGLLLFSRSVVSNSFQPLEASTPGLPVLHHLPEFAQTHVH